MAELQIDEPTLRLLYAAYQLELDRISRKIAEIKLALRQPARRAKFSAQFSAEYPRKPSKPRKLSGKPLGRPRKAKPKPAKSTVKSRKPPQHRARTGKPKPPVVTSE